MFSPHSPETYVPAPFFVHFAFSLFLYTFLCKHLLQLAGNNFRKFALIYFFSIFSVRADTIICGCHIIVLCITCNVSAFYFCYHLIICIICSFPFNYIAICMLRTFPCDLHSSLFRSHL